MDHFLQFPFSTDFFWLRFVEYLVWLGFSERTHILIMGMFRSYVSMNSGFINVTLVHIISLWPRLIYKLFSCLVKALSVNYMYPLLILTSIRVSWADSFLCGDLFV